jgi:hypothetical protein
MRQNDDDLDILAYAVMSAPTFVSNRDGVLVVTSACDSPDVIDEWKVASHFERRDAFLDLGNPQLAEIRVRRLVAAGRSRLIDRLLKELPVTDISW